MCWNKFCFFVLNRFAIVWLILANARGLRWSILKKTSSPWFFQIYILWEGFFCGSAGKESACNAGDLGLIPGLGRSPGEGKGYPLQYSGLENSMAKSGIRLSDFHFHIDYEIVVIGGFKWIFRGYWWGITAQHTIGNNFHCFSLWLGPAP